MIKLDNFADAFANLHDIFDYEEPYGNVELAGMVGLFEICFEQSWKAMKERLQADGFAEAQTGSPRQVLKTAFAAGIIEDEDAWLSALVDRNNVAHAYDKGVAMGIVKNVREIYYDMFAALKDALDALPSS